MRAFPARSCSALAGGATIGAVYALARRAGVTEVDLASRLAPGRPLQGRAAQLAAGTIACWPAARAGSPLRALARGAFVGAGPAARPGLGEGDRALAVVAHALGGLAAFACARRLR